MAVTIGSTPDAGFDEPLRLMADCHRRIEMFLGALARLAAEAETILLPQRRDALERVLTYFSKAAPRHTEDEERSLFPRMRGSGDPDIRAALAALDALEADHERAAAMHDEVERLCRSWLHLGFLEASRAEQLRARIAELTALYAPHIEIEEQLVFAAAAKGLDGSLLLEIGREMAQRRGLAWQPAGPAL